MLSYLFPPDSAEQICYFVDENVWMDANGDEYFDLQALGFTALQRNIIIRDILSNLLAEYMLVINSFGELFEIFWEKEKFK